MFSVTLLIITQIENNWNADTYGNNEKQYYIYITKCYIDIKKFGFNTI